MPFAGRFARALKVLLPALWLPGATAASLTLVYSAARATGCFLSPQALSGSFDSAYLYLWILSQPVFQVVVAVQLGASARPGLDCRAAGEFRRGLEVLLGVFAVDVTWLLTAIFNLAGFGRTPLLLAIPEAAMGYGLLAFALAGVSLLPACAATVVARRALHRMPRAGWRAALFAAIFAITYLALTGALWAVGTEQLLGFGLRSWRLSVSLWLSGAVLGVGTLMVISAIPRRANTLAGACIFGVAMAGLLVAILVLFLLARTNTCSEIWSQLLR